MIKYTQAGRKLPAAFLFFGKHECSARPNCPANTKWRFIYCSKPAKEVMCMSQRNRRLDVVFIRFERRQGRRRITAVRVIGSARPCQRFLVVGERVGPASRCLLRNG